MRREPDHAVTAKITTPHGNVVPDVPCRVYLPRTVMGRPYLEFDLSESRVGPLTVPEFSVEGHGEIPNGGVSILSDLVLTQGWREERWGSKFVKWMLPGEPWNLEITRIRNKSDKETIQSGVFWLTPNKLLNPALISLFSHTGAVEMRTARELGFQLPNAFVHFRRYFDYKDTESAVLRTSALVAELGGKLKRASLDELVIDLDDLLLVTSLATRHRCVCRGWTVHADGAETLFYRNRLAVPRAREIGTQETLIDNPNFEDFLRHAFAAFRQNDGREALRQAVDLLVSSQEGTIEASFLKCFAALETLVTLYRRNAGLSTILDPESSWPTFEKDLTSFIQGHALFKDDSSRRKLIYEKRGELNRVAFSTAYRKCTESLGKHGFHDDDLWPVVGSSKGVSLAEIRNRIVHGVVFTLPQQEALLKSLIHLRWCVERMTLAFLEWPLEQSLVGRFLRHMTPYQTWKDAQESLSHVAA